jgi:branched-chain amino acid transport system permease protein
VAGKDSREIARLGMSRTFQHVRLLPTMSVLENVAIGAHLRGSKGVWPSAWRLDRRKRHACSPRRPADRARRAREFMHDEAGSLALGQQRILEIARALCADPPAAARRAGRRPAPQGEAGPRRAAAQAQAEGMAMLIVEHDMDFVMGLVDRVVVMEFGQKIAEGLPDESSKTRPCSKPIWEVWNEAC